MTIIQNVKMQYQSDPNYKDLIMTYPSYQNKPDTIGKFFCLGCTKLNAFNLFNKDNSDKPFMTIKELNDKIIEMNGYSYLFYMNLFKGDINKVRKACEGKESYQLPEVVNSILGIKSEEKKYLGKIDIASKNDYYIIKTEYNETGHYSLIISKDLDYIDSYDGLKKNPYVKQQKILDIIKITFA